MFPIAWELMIPDIQVEASRNNHLLSVCLAPGSIASHSAEAENASTNSNNLNLLIGKWTQKLGHNYTMKCYRVKLKELYISA